MKKAKAVLRRILLAAIGFALAYGVLLNFPQPLFAYSVRAGQLIVHSDRPMRIDAARNVLELARTKLAASPLYSAAADHHVYICNAQWLQIVFFNKDYGVGGVAPYPFSRNVFLRDASVERNRLISPRGQPVGGDRTLDYFIAHEITHQLTGHFLGPIRYFRLPQWVREGYADYVGKGSSFNYDSARQAFLVGAPEMDWQKSGFYWRYHLLVAYMVDRQHWSIERLLRDPPSQASVEEQIRRNF